VDCDRSDDDETLFDEPFERSSDSDNLDDEDDDEVTPPGF